MVNQTETQEPERDTVKCEINTTTTVGRHSQANESAHYRTTEDGIGEAEVGVEGQNSGNPRRRGIKNTSRHSHAPVRTQFMISPPHAENQRNDRMTIRRLIRKSRGKSLTEQESNLRKSRTDFAQQINVSDHQISPDLVPLPQRVLRPVYSLSPATGSAKVNKTFRQVLNKNKVSSGKRRHEKTKIPIGLETDTPEGDMIPLENQISPTNPDNRNTTTNELQRTQIVASKSPRPQKWQSTIPEFSATLRRKETTERLVARRLKRLTAQAEPPKRRKTFRQSRKQDRPAQMNVDDITTNPEKERVNESSRNTPEIESTLTRDISDRPEDDAETHSRDEAFPFLQHLPKLQRTTTTTDAALRSTCYDNRGVTSRDITTNGRELSTIYPTQSRTSPISNVRDPSPSVNDIPDNDETELRATTIQHEHGHRSCDMDPELINSYEEEEMSSYSEPSPVQDDAKPESPTTHDENSRNNACYEKPAVTNCDRDTDRLKLPTAFSGTPEVDGHDRNIKATDVSDRNHRESRKPTSDDAEVSCDRQLHVCSLDDIPVPRKSHYHMRGEDDWKPPSNSGPQNAVIDLSENLMLNEDSARQKRFMSRVVRETTPQIGPLTHRTELPPLLNEKAVSVDHFIQRIDATGFLYFVDGFQVALEADLYRTEESLEGIDHFSHIATYFEAWRWSYILEASSQIIRETREPKLQPLHYTVKSRVKTDRGVFICVLSPPARRSSRRLQQFDLVMEICQGGLILIAIHIDFEDRPVKEGIPLIILGWYRENNPNVGLFRMGNARNIRTMLNAFHFISSDCKPGIRQTLQDFLSNLVERKKALIEETRQTPSFTRIVGETAHKKNASIMYTTALEYAGILNAEQSDINLKAVDMTHSWLSRDKSQRCELQRFFLVNGVPGCGKTHTAVYMICALLSYFDDQFLHEGETNFDGQVLVLTKTNKALDVFSERLTRVSVQNPATKNEWVSRTIQCFCKRSSSYIAREDVKHRYYAGQHADPCRLYNTPLVLSTFGSIMNLQNMYATCFRDDKIRLEWIARYLKVVIVDEGSQCGLLDIIQFLYAFPSFDGVIIILGDPKQMKPVVLTNVERARELLQRHFFDEFEFAVDANAVTFARMTVQYRMHQDIMNLGNDVSYEGYMKYGANESKHSQCSIPDVLSTDTQLTLPFNPVTAYTTSAAPKPLFSCQGYTNIDEIRVAETIIRLALSSDKVSVKDFVFISPYEKQCAIMKERAKQAGIDLAVHTVASFQGEEAAIVIYSLVRREGSGVGFLDQEEMLSVAITRAIHRLLIVGDLSYLGKSASGVFLKVLESLNRRKYLTYDAAQVLQLGKHYGD